MTKSKKSQSKKMKTKTTKRVSRSNKLKLTSQQPTVLYSRDPETGEETVASTAYSNNKGVKTFMAKMNSRMPPTVYQSNNGSTVMTSSQKKAMVVQSYTNMNQSKFKTRKTKKTKKSKH
jgi:hypothetical protein